MHQSDYYLNKTSLFGLFGGLMCENLEAV